jgi:WD40 repeat protein
LEWIPLKAVRKDRTRRYRSVAEFADDIENYLLGAPLIAGPESTTYRVGKFVRRHRAVAFAVASVAVVLVLATLVSTILYVRAISAEKISQAQRDNAEHERQVAEQERGRADREASRARRNAYVSDMSRAAHAWETGDLSRARTLLSRHRPQSSQFGEASFEWRLLWGLAHEEKTLFGFHAGAEPVASVALSAHGRFLAWCDGGRVRIVDLETRSERLMLPAPVSRIHSLAFSANGQWLAIGGDDGLITLWNVPTWTMEASLEGHRGRVSHLSFRTDEKRLVSLGADETVRIWDLTVWAEMSAYANPEKDVKLSVSADGRLLGAFGGLNNTVRFYGLEPNLPLRATLPRQKGIILSVEFAADAKSAIISAHDSSVTRWELEPLQPLTTYWQKVLVYQMALSADGRILATAGGDNLIKVWDVTSGQELRVLRGHTVAVSHLCLSADGSTLVSADIDNRIKVWTTDPTGETNVLTQEGIVIHTAVAPEGELLVTNNPNFFTVDLWDLQSGAATRFVTDARAEPAFSPDGKWLALRRVTDPMEVELWDRTTTPYHKVSVGPCAFSIGHQLRFSPDSRILVFRAPGAVLELWDTVARQSLGQLPDHPSIYCGTAFSGDGELIATGCDGRIRIWHVRSRELLAAMGEQHDDVRSLCFSSDDNMLIAASGNAEVRRWDVTDPESPHPLSPLRGHTAFVNQIALSPDGKTLASGGWDSTLRLWDPLAGQELMTLRAHSAVISCLAWSPDGQSLYTGSGDATVRIWRAATEHEIQTQSAPVK